MVMTTGADLAGGTRHCAVPGRSSDATGASWLVQLPWWGRGRGVVAAAGGLGLAFALWWLVAAAKVLPAGSVPTPVQVVRDLAVNHSYYLTNAWPTTLIAVQGFAVAALASLVAGTIGSATLLLERSVGRVALAVYCLPLPALLPLIAGLLAPGPATQVTMAALFSFYPMLMGVLMGLRSTPPDAAAIVRCAGGGGVQVLLKVGLRSALPNVMSGMRIAGPGALLGALVAEFSGAANGLGVALVVSQQKLQTTQTWGLAVVATVIGGLMYAAVTTLARALHADPVDAPFATAPQRAPSVRRRLAEAAVPPLALLGIWVAAVRLGGASPLVFKSPADVLGYLTTDPQAAEHRSVLGSDWLVTIGHTATILATGLAAALVAGCLLVTFPGLLRLTSPLLLASQCVPQIAFIPLLVAICGRGTALIVVTGLLVVFFPAMVVIVSALEERSQVSLDLIAAYGGRRTAALRFARVPGAVPGLLGAVRISIPLALFGALVAEWLVTGTGISAAMSTATVTFDYTRLWADVVIMTVTVVTLETAAGAVHEWARRQYG
jgi:ABC-type nitrate/sulfonate/bicarbonate transport system permease component